MATAIITMLWLKLDSYCPRGVPEVGLHADLCRTRLISAARLLDVVPHSAPRATSGAGHPEGRVGDAFTRPQFAFRQKSSSSNLCHAPRARFGNVVSGRPAGVPPPADGHAR